MTLLQELCDEIEKKLGTVFCEHCESQGQNILHLVRCCKVMEEWLRKIQIEGTNDYVRLKQIAQFADAEVERLLNGD